MMAGKINNDKSIIIGVKKKVRCLYSRQTILNSEVREMNEEAQHMCSALRKCLDRISKKGFFSSYCKKNALDFLFCLFF